MPGLFDMLDDNNTVGLLSAGSAMMNASGPSLMPRSFGQVLGTGFDGLQKSRKDMQDRTREQMQMDMLRQQVAQATRKNELINNFLANNMSGQPGASQAAMPQMGAVPDGAPMPPAAPGTAPSTPALQAGAGFGGVPSAAIAADLAFGNGANISKFINERSAPTDFTKLLIQSGIDPSSALGRQMMQQQIAKQNNIPLVAGRAGAPMYDQSGQVVAMAPMIPKNAVPQIENGRVTGVTPLSGAAGVEQINAYADQSGKNQAEPTTAYDASGNPIFTNKLTAATGGKWTGGKLSDGDLSKLRAGADAGNANAKTVLASYEAAQGNPSLRPALAPGVEGSIAGNVNTMNSDFADLYAVNKNAPVTLALLDNIKKLAPLAITGAQADKLAFNNGLLALAGIPAAKDLASATDLLNKNANMLAIRQRLGAGGGGSDALQVLAQAANPNSHMQPEAIVKAADELIGQTKMTQDMYGQLLPFKMKNDAAGFYETQRKLTSTSDPRTYQPATAKVITLSDIAATAKSTGKTTAEVTAAARKQGYTIGGQ